MNVQIQIPINAAPAFTVAADMVAVECPRPKLTVMIGKYTPTIPAVPEFGIRGHTPDYKPAVPETPATLDAQRGLQIELTDDEWNDWPAGDAASDEAYLRGIVLRRLSYTEKK